MERRDERHELRRELWHAEPASSVLDVMDWRHHLQQNNDQRRNEVLLADCCQEWVGHNKRAGVVVHDRVVINHNDATTATSDVDDSMSHRSERQRDDVVRHCGQLSGTDGQRRHGADLHRVLPCQWLGLPGRDDDGDRDCDGLRSAEGLLHVHGECVVGADTFTMNVQETFC